MLSPSETETEAPEAQRSGGTPPRDGDAGPPAAPGLVRDLIALTKPRLSALVLFTAGGGLWLSDTPVPATTAAAAVLGTTLVVGGANALNCYLERDVDQLMGRTALRPLPAGRLHPSAALAFGLLLSFVSVPLLTFATTPLAGLLAAVALVLYVVVYTPMKRRSSLSTLVGAVPGALPPLIGWTAATGQLDPGGLALFAILLLWQIPHSLAIGVYRRMEYEAAGLVVFPSEHGLPATRPADAPLQPPPRGHASGDGLPRRGGDRHPRRRVRLWRLHAVAVHRASGRLAGPVGAAGVPLHPRPPDGAVRGPGGRPVGVDAEAAPGRPGRDSAPPPLAPLLGPGDGRALVGDAGGAPPPGAPTGPRAAARLHPHRPAGAPVSAESLEGRIILDFIFTRCPDICPTLSAQMAAVRDALGPTPFGGPPLRLVSVTVDPTHDQPEVLRAYAEGYGAEPARWSFLTGDPAAVDGLVAGLAQTLARRDRPDGAPPEITHSQRLLLLDPAGQVRGFHPIDEAGLEALRAGVAAIAAEHR